MTAVGVELRGVTVGFGARTVLRGMDLDLAPGEFVALVGRSGSGKSTLLRLLAGLAAPDAGQVRIGEQGAREVAGSVRLVFQDARLLPWTRVLANVTLGLGPGAEPAARRLLRDVELSDRADDWPGVLSGGERQRVALARALLHRPALLLLDEPLGALDALTRLEMQALVERLWREHPCTALLVTHDVWEAVALADRVLLLEDGRIAFEERVTLARPRRADDPRFGAHVSRLLARVRGGEQRP